MLIKLQLLCKKCGEEYEPEEDGFVQLDYGVCEYCGGRVISEMKMAPEKGEDLDAQ